VGITAGSREVPERYRPVTRDDNNNNNNNNNIIIIKEPTQELDIEAP